MIPELRVLVERAQMGRTALEGLLEAIPADYWQRPSADGRWSARNHLKHLATVDTIVCNLLDETRTGADVWLGGPEPGGLERRRGAAMLAVAGVPVDGLLDLMRESRGATLARIARLAPASLEATVRLADMIDAWGAPAGWPLRRYLASWAGHDAVHGSAIRDAVTAPPDLGTVLLTRRRR